MTDFDVVGFGALNVDRLFKVNKIACAEEESYVTDYTETCGGSAANTIVGLARLGCRVGFIGKVAPDREGRVLVGDFFKEGVDTNGIIHAKRGRTGKAMGFVGEKGERALYIDPGVNDTVAFEEVETKYAFETKFLHLTSFVGEKSLQSQKRLLEILPERVKVSLDPGALYAAIGLKKLGSIVAKASVIMPNVGELRLLTDRADYREGVKLLFKKGVELVAVKLGRKGCYVSDRKERHLIEPPDVNVVDTTGAGDAFCAGFLYGVINGENLLECGRIGNFVASRCIMKTGARTGLPTLKDLMTNKSA